MDNQKTNSTTSKQAGLDKIKQTYSQELLSSIIDRLETMPPNVKLSIGSEGAISIKDLIEHIKKGDETGNLMVKMQLNYFKSLEKKRGSNLENDNSDN